MVKPMILGISHDTCAVCGKDIRMRNDRKLYHHGHPARRCPGAGRYGIRIDKFLAQMEAKRAEPPQGCVCQPEGCICPVFSDTGGFRIADLTCPVHGVGGTDPGDGYWEHAAEAREKVPGTQVPGTLAQHVIITPKCRRNRTDQGAWDEAVARVTAQYDSIVAGWAGASSQPTIHLLLTVERP